jgi:phosphoribosylanthranilate isomerase
MNQEQSHSNGTKPWIKVCGMMAADNVAEIAALGVSRIGFIFHPSSPRYVGGMPSIPKEKSGSAKRIGVFVNASIERVLEVAAAWSLDGVQLHGEESPSYCESLRAGFKGEIIKAIAVSGESVEPLVAPYESFVDYILFDTACSTRGGSGNIFSWELLKNYRLRTPFIVAGGLDGDAVLRLQPFFAIDQLAGIDLNSRVEQSIGRKDVTRVAAVVKLVAQSGL